MARSPRTHPLLASDLWRSLIAFLLSLPVAFAVTVVLGLSGALVGVESRSLTAASYFIAWTAFVVVLVVMTVARFATASATDLRRWMRETTPRPVFWRRFLWATLGGGAVPLALTVSTITVIALVIIATNRELRGSPVVIGTGIATAAASLAAIIVGYAVRYAREDATRGGFAFSGEDRPAFGSYFYLAVQVTTTYSSSDVALVAPNARRMVAVHALVAFVFTTVIVALFVAVLLSAVTS